MAISTGLNAPITSGLFNQSRHDTLFSPTTPAVKHVDIGEISAASQIRGALYSILMSMENAVFSDLPHPMAQEVEALMSRHESLQFAERAPHAVNAQDHLAKLEELQQSVLSAVNVLNHPAVNRTRDNVTALILDPFAEKVFGGRNVHDMRSARTP